MVENSGRTLVCSVLFLDIVEYSKQSVNEQLQLKQAFNSVLAGALDAVATRDRVLVDTGDGAAVAFLGDPEDALFVALAIRDNASRLPIRMGVNLGPVRLVKDLNGQVNIIGDGINVAQRVMSFAEPGQLLVSRSFYEVASRLSNDYAELFMHEGSRTDKHVREHEVYSVNVDSRADPRIATESRRHAQSNAGRLSSANAVLTTHGPDENVANQPAQVFDAGANLIISGYSKSSVQDALDTLADSGARLISPIAQVNNKWTATCEHPNVPVSACKVETLGHRRIVTGPTREAVSAKVEELVQFGAILVRDVQYSNGMWIAICETDAPVR
ncbi:MAG TPA: adenylate/guanylate cyclase domain-containing protein [Burkholderiales bacterium]|jgi:class 3 adenylate cyclase|nr:adenylate/guanylate cyclase domain-containing protein [Burkholderiales bacterium]